jgi:hypothetical protein
MGGAALFRAFFEVFQMTKQRNETTSAKAATAASKVLRDPKSTPTQKTAAASALTQVASRKVTPTRKR